MTLVRRAKRLGFSLRFDGSRYGLVRSVSRMATEQDFGSLDEVETALPDAGPMSGGYRSRGVDLDTGRREAEARWRRRQDEDAARIADAKQRGHRCPGHFCFLFVEAGDRLSWVCGGVPVGIPHDEARCGLPGSGFPFLCDRDVPLAPDAEGDHYEPCEPALRQAGFPDDYFRRSKEQT
jgi:hypothetical protein